MTDAERDEVERKLFLEVDQFFLANRDAFREAFEKLEGMAFTNNRGAIIESYEKTIRCGDFTERSAIGTAMPAYCAAMILTVYFHLTMGSALFINWDLIMLWNTGDGQPAQCLACGLRVPKAVLKCLHCGGQIGKTGEWDRTAWLNRVAN